MDNENVQPSKEELIKEINNLKKEKKAVILVHNYQLDEVQEVADFLGDSLELSRKAANVKEAEVIVFCGVKFMAETAAILSDKKVLLPVLDAGCPMANMVTAKQIEALKAENPDSVVVTYVNSTVETKAVSDYCCTSANAAKVVNHIPSDKTVIFAPDKHLGEWVTKDQNRKTILWQGFCPVHQRMSVKDIEEMKNRFPNAQVIVHPEAPLDVCLKADIVASTGGMVKHVKNMETGSVLIVGTEIGMINRLRRERPDITYIPLSGDLVCSNMKKTRLIDVRNALKEMKHHITVEPETAEKAKNAINRMLEIG